MPRRPGEPRTVLLVREAPRTVRCRCSVAEQADSFHVRCDRTGPVIEWLEKSGALGVVLPPRGPLITVIVPAHHVGSVIAASHFMMIFYEFLEGERVTARLFDGAREVAHLERSFEDGTSRFDAKPWITHRFLDRARAKTLERGLRAPWPDRHERHWVADALGLHGVVWSSGEELMTRRAEFVARFPGAILVQAGDPVVDAERRPYRSTTPPAMPRSTPAPTRPGILRSTAAPDVPPPSRPDPPPHAAPQTPPRSTPMPSASPISTETRAAAPAPQGARPSTPAMVPKIAPTPATPRALELDTEAVREAAARQPRSTAPVRRRTQPPNRPALIPDLPLTDEFASDTPVPPAPAKASGLVLCALSKHRQDVLRQEPRLIEALLETRFEETIPGLLDLGTRANDLAALLATLGEAMIEALRASTARPIPGTDIRIADKRLVVQIAAALRTIDLEAAIARASGTYRLGEDLRDLITLYTEAAQRGNAMLIARG